MSTEATPASARIWVRTDRLVADDFAFAAYFKLDQVFGERGDHPSFVAYAGLNNNEVRSIGYKRTA
jgi:hypothetical protein